MQIHLYSNLRNIIGSKSIVHDLDKATSLNDLLASLAKEFPALVPVFYDPDGAFSAQMPVFLNGRNPRLLPGGLNTKVSNTDVLSLFTPIASGKMNVEALQQAVIVIPSQEEQDED